MVQYQDTIKQVKKVVRKRFSTSVFLPIPWAQHLSFLVVITNIPDHRDELPMVLANARAEDLQEVTTENTGGGNCGVDFGSRGESWVSGKRRRHTSLSLHCTFRAAGTTSRESTCHGTGSPGALRLRGPTTRTCGWIELQLLNLATFSQFCSRSGSRVNIAARSCTAMSIVSHAFLAGLKWLVQSLEAHLGKLHILADPRERSAVTEAGRSDCAYFWPSCERYRCRLHPTRLVIQASSEIRRLF